MRTFFTAALLAACAQGFALAPPLPTCRELPPGVVLTRDAITSDVAAALASSVLDVDTDVPVPKNVLDSVKVSGQFRSLDRLRSRSSLSKMFPRQASEPLPFGDISSTSFGAASSVFFLSKTIPRNASSLAFA